MDETERHEKRCSLCRQYGHTRWGCPNQPTTGILSECLRIVGGGICQIRSRNQTSFSVNDSFLCAACCATNGGLAPSNCSTIAHVSVLYH
ncbi:hypothetical protein Ahy_A03g011163 isoform A [Arachis hypogaea]|uniref:Uncharacterized protein n=1 Tax=Arachis hypogaea TaxID=3818 RepID=A0A445DPU6_ARAHY|nr:hypothetical protein Ahy_A03g011163 isoform A [Arachis hypogaea]